MPGKGREVGEGRRNTRGESAGECVSECICTQTDLTALGVVEYVYIRFVHMCVHRSMNTCERSGMSVLSVCVHKCVCVSHQSRQGPG